MFIKTMKLKVFASLAEDINNGWVWLPESILGQRTVVRIKNKNTGKIVYCEALQVGKNYLNFTTQMKEHTK